MHASRTPNRQTTPRRIHLPCGCVVCQNWSGVAIRNEIQDTSHRCNHCGDTVYLPHLGKKKKQPIVRKNS